MIAFACDHAGYTLKKTILDYLEQNGYEFKDFGCFDESPVDYPVYGKMAARAVASGECEKGILICGTGIGISIAANKVRGVRAAHCSDALSAKLTRLHNDANVIAFGARIVGPETALSIVEAFLTTEFSGKERHQKRIDQLED